MLSRRTLRCLLAPSLPNPFQWDSMGVFLLCVGHVAAQSINGPITENVSLLDSGLTTLAAISTFVVTLMRRRLDAEIGLRQCQIKTGANYERPGLLLFGQEHSFNFLEGLVLTTQPYWHAAVDFCQYAITSHNTGPCMMLIVRFMELPGVEHSGLCRNACTCIASRYVQELEALLALTYSYSVRVHSLKFEAEAEDREWYVYQCKCCIEGKCHNAITRELCIPDPVPLDLRDITRSQKDSLGLALDSGSGYINDLFSIGNQTLLLPLRRYNKAKMMSMFGLSLEGMDAVSRGRMHSLTNGLRLPDYRSSEEYTEPWQGSIYYISGLHACEVLINLGLVLFFRIDPMSAALAARRAVRGYTVDSTGSSVTLAEYLQAARVVKDVGLVEGVMQMRLQENNQPYRAMRFIPAAGNILGLILWSAIIITGKYPIKWTGGYEAVLPNWGLYILLFPTLLSITSAFVAWGEWRQCYFAVPVVSLAILGEITVTLIFARYHVLRRAVQLSIAWLSFVQWQLGTQVLGPGGPDQSPPSTRSTLVYAQTFVLTGFLAATSGKWQ